MSDPTDPIPAPPIDGRLLRYFVVVAQELNFRRAARRLGVAQPALSRAIQQLEGMLGVALMTRTRRQVALTEAGRVFLDGGRRALAGLATLVDETRRAGAGESGHLVIGYTDFAISGVLPTLLQRFRTAYPQVTVDLVHMVTAVQLRGLAHGEITVGFMTGPIADPAIETVTVQDERLVAVLPREHPLARQRAVALADLAGQPFITGQAVHWRHYLAHMTAACQAAGFVPHIVQEAFNSEGIFGLIAANMGVTLHVEGARNYVRKGIAIRPLTDSPHRVPTVAAWSAGLLAPALARFVAFLRQTASGPSATPVHEKRSPTA